MGTKIIQNGIVLTIVYLVGSLATAGGDKKPSGETGKGLSPKLAAIAWIAGEWRADVNGDQLDEYWSPPAGDSMFGAFRWMKGGKAWMYEMLTIIDEGDDVIMRIKHFDNKGVGWEAKDEAITMRLVRNDAGTAEFDRIQSDDPVKFTFRKPSLDELNIVLEVKNNGEWKKNEFRFRRSRS